jgi:hypothetical protein
MASKVAPSKASNGQQKPGTRRASAPANELIPPGVSEPREDQGTSWGDRFAFKMWVICFLLMALMVAYDAIGALLRGTGRN